MILADKFHTIAVDRGRSYPVRMAAAVVICGASILTVPSATPLIWLAAVMALQTLDYVLLARFRRGEPCAPTLLQWRGFLGLTLVNSLVFSSLAIYLWVLGGEARNFSCIMLCGATLHTAMLKRVNAAYSAATLGPPLVLLSAMPSLSFLGGIEAARQALTMTAAAFIYVGHLWTSVRLNERSAAALARATEDANQAQHRAEQANMAKSEFLATISHEIRTPMNAVISAADLLRRTRLSPAQAEYVHMLVNGGETLLGLVNDVLDLSKIEAGKLSVEARDTDVAELLSGVVSLWEPRARDKGLDLRLHRPDAPPGPVRTDPLRLKQIIANLLSNAIKFTEAGYIHVRYGMEPARGSAPARLWVEICDTGCGIDLASQERLFERFEQADSATTRRFGGTGLGLAISRRLAQMLGGDVTVTSQLGLGSVFRVEIAADAVHDAGEEGAMVSGQQPEVQDEKPLSILVAEDHEVNRRIIGLFLEPLGWGITMVENGAEAVAAADIEAFDLILLDMQMPVMSGLQATSIIRTHGGPNACTPIVALTANAMDDQRAIWEAAGADAFLTKPIDARLLVATIHRLAGCTGAVRSPHSRGAAA